MDSDIDYSKYTEAELVEMFGRLDPRFAPAECARLGQRLTELGYIVTQGDTGPGFAEPSPAKLQKLIGTSRPFECAVEFGKGAGPFSYLERTHNDLGFVGSGRLRTDGVYVDLSGQVGPKHSLLPSLSQHQVQLATRQIANVESQGRLVRFEYGPGEMDAGAITLELPDEDSAAALVAVLPKTRTKDFQPRIKANAEFEAQLVARSPKTPVTFGLVAINVLIFIATLFDGAEWFRPVGNVQIAWGSNFGPYTTDGEWWRLFTSMFIHFGIAHIFFNMLALASFGPLVERLFGSALYLLIYLLAGILGSLASTAWHPALNSAGASGAIFGICGALLAVLLRAGKSFPEDISRPIRYSTLVFLGWALYASVRYSGVDYAAHVGGLVSGFFLGLAAAPPIGGAKLPRPQRIPGLLRMVPIAAALLIAGVWWAQTRAAVLVGDGLYYRTVHSIRSREHAVNGEFNVALKRSRQDPPSLERTLERDVIPFWREAADQLATIELPRNSPHRERLDTLLNISDRRAQAFQLLDEGLRSSDPQVIAAASQQLKQIDQLATRTPDP
jgi:rhomboid protease GluP